MKKLLTLSIALSLATNMMAAEPNSDGLEKDKAVYLELLGASNMVGINYDQRFNDHTKWGWRAGRQSTCPAWARAATSRP